MICRGPGFLAVLRFGSSPTPLALSRQQLVSLSRSSCVSPVELYGGSIQKEFISDLKGKNKFLLKGLGNLYDLSLERYI